MAFYFNIRTDAYRLSLNNNNIISIIFDSFFVSLRQSLGVQPGGTSIRVGHQVGRPRPGRHLGDIDETAEVLQEDVGQERGEHQDHEDTEGAGIPAVRVQQQQLAAAVQMTRI